MNKSGLLLDIKQSNNCVYVKLLRIFLIGLTRKENELGNNISLTLGISKLHFTNDCDPNLTICELQHWLGKAEEILRTLMLTKEPNSDYFKKLAKDYFTKQEKSNE